MQVPTKIGLALHTTTETLEIAAILIQERIAQLDSSSSETRSNEIRSRKWLLGRELSSQIHTCLADFMEGYDWEDLVFVAIASGVGSFTSTRIGVVVARTLGEQLNIPVYAIACADIEAQAKITQNSHGVDLLQIAHQQWLDHIYPHWSTALPLYS